MKKLILLSLFSLFAIASNAQTFFDGFESYKADSADYLYPKGPWTIDTTFWPYPHPAPMVRSTTRGVVPYEGDKMLEIRSVSNGDLAGIFSPAGPYPQVPSVEYSLRFCVASKDFLGQRFGASLPNFESHTHSVSFDWLHQRVVTSGTGGGDRLFALGLPFDQWIKYSVRIDFKAFTLSYLVNDKILDSRSLNQVTIGKGASSWILGSRIDSDVTDRYPQNAGAPGVFVDAVRIQVVPEPSPMQVSIASLLAWAIAKLGRKK